MHVIHLTHKKILIALLLVTAVSRLLRLDYPNQYVFDEVYHAFTAKEYAQNHKESWEWWTQPPPGVAYEWTHPPLAKELMAASLIITKSEDAWVYRLPGTILGIISVYLVYAIGRQLFKNNATALAAGVLFSMDGLNFVQSRTGMNDIYFVTFMLACLLFFIQKRYFVSSVFLGLSLATKWTGLYLVGLIIFISLFQTVRYIKTHTFVPKFLPLIFFLAIPPIIYLISYIPFLINHPIEQFVHLQQQMWWYHTGLKATHDYASAWWSWPLNLYPVWYFVEYQSNSIANIFATGNPLLFWMGTGAMVLAIWDFIRQRTLGLLVIICGFFAFWLPWAMSPRIMFLYHFSPSVPFMCLALAYQIPLLTNSKHINYASIICFLLVILGFLLLYPVLTGIPLPKELLQYFFKIHASKNPFI